MLSVHWDTTGYPGLIICIIGTHRKTNGATNTLGCHWNHTGWCQHPVLPQWQSSFNLHNWYTLEYHWKTTGSTLETHWLPTILSPVAFQCTLGSKLQAQWIATGLPLDYHWLRVGVRFLLKLVLAKNNFLRHSHQPIRCLTKKWPSNNSDLTGNLLNTLRPRQNGRHFPDDILKRIFLNKNIVFWWKFHWNMFPGSN